MLRSLQLASLLLISHLGFTSASFLIGRGIADATGVISDGILYGYANPSQEARGLHLRQFSRAFIIADSAGTSRVVVVVVEATMVSQAVTAGVMEKLEELYGDVYTERNVLLSPTHSHACPGGFHTYLMYMAPSFGFIPQTYDAFVNGIVTSIQRAHDSLQEGDVMLSQGDLLDASANRSPASYNNNPDDEKLRYERNFDSMMSLLKFKATSGEDLGVISFFAVHPTSMLNTNHLLSSDNKGYAAQRMEAYLNPGAFPGVASIPAAFAQTTNADVSPNTGGALCETTDEPCDEVTSTCPEDPLNPALCTSRAETGEEFEDTRINGEKQFLKAKELFEAAGEALTGEVSFIHKHINMSEVVVTALDGQNVTLCRPAMGFSFAAGTTDGGGFKPFTQGDTEGHETVQALIRSIVPYPDDYVTCHAPKPILIPSGYVFQSWPFQPEILPLQIFKIGNFVLVGVPGEVTTMAGRRIAEGVKEAMVAAGASDTLMPLVLSMANSYSSYITTPEEYQIQRYEGASTIFGPNTLTGYVKELTKLATALVTGDDIGAGPSPPDLRGKPPVIVGRVKTDSKGWTEAWGDTVSDVSPTYQQGEIAAVTFRSGNPRNDLKTGDTYLAVEKQVSNDTWQGILTDAFWETRLYWDSDCHDVGIIPPARCLLAQTSNATVAWHVPQDQQPGTYRILHYGNAKTLTGVKSYTGISSTFEVLAN